MVTTGFDLLQSFDPRIQPYLECLLQDNSKITLTGDFLEITNPFSGVLTSVRKNETKYDRFKLRIPYANQVLTWEIIFDVTNVKEPPDIIFDADDDNFHPPMERINSLVCWDWRNKESLAALISELLELYKEYQLERVGQNKTLQRHFTSLMSQNVEAMQIIVNRAERGLGTVNVVAKLDVDFSELPPYLIQENPGVDMAALHVCFPYPESTNIQSQLYLSPAVENAFGGSGSLRIPVFQPGILLGEYFLNMKQLLKKQIKVISEGLEKRKDYIAAFLAHFGRSVLEYDAQHFSKIVLLLEWNDFFFTFTAELPLYFPVEHPTFILKSVYHYQNRQPYFERYTDFPYSPRWSGMEMARRASAFILDQIRSFQRASVNNSDK
ncbi:BRISC and BRCA1-A complex member 2 [Aplysia californica]|uniref:BRISC and BRCA1-A complex member 2 n=1 Tax=Aplysia californica TaxID=6500 RepID=A0ABM0K1Y1_APLCA|nr:BRISC and BRCA1-A complex member 2 [Aplysia californica]